MSTVLQSDNAKVRKKIDEMQKLYQDMVFCVNNIDTDTGLLSEFLTDQELHRVFIECRLNTDALNLYIEDKTKLSNNWSKLQKLFQLYESKQKR